MLRLPLLRLQLGLRRLLLRLTWLWTTVPSANAVAATVVIATVAVAVEVADSADTTAETIFSAVVAAAAVAVADNAAEATVEAVLDDTATDGGVQELLRGLSLSWRIRFRVVTLYRAVALWL